MEHNLEKLDTLLGVSGQSLFGSSCSFPLPADDVLQEATVADVELHFEHWRKHLFLF
jgi:hypothetical protein